MSKFSMKIATSVAIIGGMIAGAVSATISPPTFFDRPRTDFVFDDLDSSTSMAVACSLNSSVSSFSSSSTAIVDSAVDPFFEEPRVRVLLVDDAVVADTLPAATSCGLFVRFACDDCFVPLLALLLCEAVMAAPFVRFSCNCFSTTSCPNFSTHCFLLNEFGGLNPSFTKAAFKSFTFISVILTCS